MTAGTPAPEAPPLWALAVRQSVGAEPSATASGPAPGGALWREVLPKTEEREIERPF